MDGSLNSDDDPTILCGEDIEEVEPGTGDGLGPAGLALYKETEDESAEPSDAGNSCHAPQ